MKKVAIVGVEGSGKTVMLAGLGELYTYPDKNGYFLAPKNFGTAAYVTGKIARMRKGEWPTATASDVMQGLDWTLKQRRQEGQRPVDVCEVSCLDFAGEVYRYAFVRQDATPTDLADEVESLKSYVREADNLIVLINLRDVIAHGEQDLRVQEAMWITNAILSYALDEQDGRNTPRAAIMLSQADSYADTIRSCGGPKGVLAKYLPHVANNYDWLDILAVSAVDKTVLDRDGVVVPAPDFKLDGLRAIINWILPGVLEDNDGEEEAVEAEEAEEAEEDDEDDTTASEQGSVHHVDTWKVLKICLVVLGVVVLIPIVIYLGGFVVKCISWICDHWIISLIVVLAIFGARDSD